MEKTNMSLLSGVNKADNAEKETDRLGGFQLLESGVHSMEVEIAYLNVAASGARGLVLHFKNDTGSLRSTQWFASGDKKGNKTFFEIDGKQFNLPGFTITNDIFLAAGIAEGLDGAQLEEKIIKLYSKDASGEVPTKVQMVMNLIGKKVGLGVLKQTVDKTALGGDNEYHPTGETRDENEINKVFTLEGLTIPEVEANITEPAFIIDWKDKYDGVTQMKAKGAGKDAPASGAPTTAPKKLFK